MDQHTDILNLSKTSVSEAITSLKNISNNLSPHMLEKFGLISAITSFIEPLKKLSRINFIIESNLSLRLPAIVEISLYRIINECINNSLKHSNSNEISIVLNIFGNHLNLIYKDNGKGFDVKTAMETQPGMGLHNIQNRITTLGGKVNIQSVKNIGTEISADIPI